MTLRLSGQEACVGPKPNSQIRNTRGLLEQNSGRGPGTSSVSRVIKPGVSNCPFTCCQKLDVPLLSLQLFHSLNKIITKCISLVYLSPPQIPITHPTLEMTPSTRGPWRGSGLPAWRWWRGTWWRRRGVCRAIDFHTSGRWLGGESVGPPSLLLPQWPCHWGVACTQAC